MLSVDCRLAPEHPFPAAVEDAYAAVEWVAENADAVDGDGPVAVAAVAALMAAEKGGPELEYQVLLYPGVGVEEGQASLEEHAGIVLSVDDVAWFRDCSLGSEVRQRNPDADSGGFRCVGGAAGDGGDGRV